LFHVIFDSFTQPKAIKKRKHGGTGLGLAIVKKLIHLLDSEIFVESVLNSGSKFYFDLDLNLAKKRQFIQIQKNKRV
jgi:signal transduction histidine kinase